MTGSTSRLGAVVLGAALAGLVVVQVSLVAYLPTPAATPDLVIVAVLALGHARGPLAGGLAGAWAGMVLDLVPPAAGPLGAWTLVLAGSGVLLGRVSASYRPGPFAAMALIALGTGAAVLAHAGVMWFAGRAIGADLALTALASVGYAVALAPIALLLVTRRPGPTTAPLRSVPVEVVPG